MTDKARWAYIPASMDEVRRRAESLLYLGNVEKIMVALANEYGADRKLPSRASIQEKLDQRNSRKPYGGRMAEGCEL